MTNSGEATWRSANRAHWDERTAIHLAPGGFLVHRRVAAELDARFQLAGVLSGKAERHRRLAKDSRISP